MMKNMFFGKTGNRRLTPKVRLSIQVQLALAVLVAIGFLLYPLPGNAAESIAVARLTGTASRNGLPLLDGSIVFNGDVITTDHESALRLAPSPHQQVWLGPGTSAKLIRNAGNLAVALVRGTVRFAGSQIRVTVGPRDFTVRSRGTAPVVGQLTLVNRQRAQVWLEKGTLELEQGGHSVALRANQSGSLSLVSETSQAASPTQDATSPTESGRSTVSGTVVNPTLFVIPSATVTLVSTTGSRFTTTTNNEGAFVFDNIPFGTYTLTVSHAGYKNYEKSDLVVTSGKISSLYIELTGGRGPVGVAGNHKALIIGVVVVGGAAAGGIGAWLAISHTNKTVSPSAP